MDRRLTPDDLPLAGQGEAPFLRGEIADLVRALPGKQKEAVLLRCYQEMPLEEMARAMADISAGERRKSAPLFRFLFDRKNGIRAKKRAFPIFASEPS